MSWDPDLYDLQFQDWPVEGEANRIHAFISELCPEAVSLLDVACGTGRHLEVLRRWYEAEGLDKTPAMLAAARRRLGSIALHEADMADFDLGRTFDAVICLSASIAWAFTDVADLRRTISCMARHLSTPGVLLVDPWDPPDEQGNRFRVPWVHQAGDDQRRIVLMESQRLVDGVWEVVGHHLLWTSEGIEHVVEHSRVGAFTGDDYRCAFRDAGLTVDYDPKGLVDRGLYLGVKS